MEPVVRSCGAVSWVGRRDAQLPPIPRRAPPEVRGRHAARRLRTSHPQPPMRSSAAAPTFEAFLALARGRRGHFRLESGHHAALWLDLDGLFADWDAVAPFVRALVLLGDVGRARLEAHGVPVVAAATSPFEIWLPDACPSCAAGMTLECPVG